MQFLCKVFIFVGSCGWMFAKPLSFAVLPDETPGEVYLILYNQSNIREVIDVRPEAFRFLVDNRELSLARGPIGDTSQAADGLCVLDSGQAKVLKFVVILEGGCSGSLKLYVANSAKTHFWLIEEKAGVGVRISINDEARGRFILSNEFSVDRLIVKQKTSHPDS